jgi:hypothetical protein
MLGLLHEKTAKWVNQLDKNRDDKLVQLPRDEATMRSRISRDEYTIENAVSWAGAGRNQYPWSPTVV